MKASNIFQNLSFAVVASLCAASCVNYPTLVQVARERQASKAQKNDLTVTYRITDRDVLNYTDRVKSILVRNFTSTSSLRYGASGTQVTLGALAGAAKTLGWTTSTASGLGAGSTLIYGLGQSFDSKTAADAYEVAFTEIQHAESSYYFHQVGGKFTTPDAKGKAKADFTAARLNSDIPTDQGLTGDGETLYYRTSSILKVLDDALAKKIPDLQTLKDAKGDTSPSSTPSPAK